MTEEIIIDGELSCNNCLEKTRCKQQQEVKVKRIDAILSYIANEDNEKYIAELKNEIPAITRCDVVLEKQLKRAEIEIEKLKGIDGSVHPDSAYYKITRLEQENKDLKKQIESDKGLITVGSKQQYECLQKIELEQENKELKEVKEQLKKWNDENLKRQDDMQLWIDLAEEQRRKYRSALEEIKTILDKECGVIANAKAVGIINEVLSEN